MAANRAWMNAVERPNRHSPIFVSAQRDLRQGMHSLPSRVLGHGGPAMATFSIWLKHGQGFL